LITFHLQELLFFPLGSGQKIQGPSLAGSFWWQNEW